MMTTISNYKVKRKTNGESWAVKILKNGRNSNYKLVEAIYIDKNDEEFGGYVCIGPRGGVNRRYSYFGYSVSDAVEALETVIGGVVMDYRRD